MSGLERMSVRRPRPRARIVVIAGPGLDHADTEAIAVARAAGAHQTLIGDAATVHAVRRALDGASIVHIACHGRYYADNPLLSSLRLVDGPITVYELERLRRAPSLVVLSACNSAIGAPSAGEELMGLAACLLSLGCRALVGTVARVADASALPLMEAFHDRLAAGHSPAASLGLARSWIRATDRTSVAAAVAFGCFGAGS